MFPQGNLVVDDDNALRAVECMKATQAQTWRRVLMNPLISILITAYNAERVIAYTLQSAIAQTWPRKEVIVVNDGSTDRTAEVARRFASHEVEVVSTDNQGLSGASNLAYQLSQGDYIQWLDSDDLLAVDKIARQVAALQAIDSKRILPSSPWAPFYYRTRHARFVRNSLWEDLSPLEWLLRKMANNHHMGNSTWLVSREVAEATGPWDVRLHYDQDGEYFSRALLVSDGTRFVPGTGIFYRVSNSSRVSYIGNSDKKKESMLLSIKLHIERLQSLEDSDRVRKACLTYIQNWYPVFYPERPDIVAELQELATQLQGQLETPRLRWKYAWLQPLFGWKAAKWAQNSLPQYKGSCLRCYDKVLFNLESRRIPGSPQKLMQ